MSIPLYIFLFIYLAFLLILLALFLVNVTHLAHAGALTLNSFVMTIFIGAAVVFILFFTSVLLAGTDWQQTITVWNNSWIGNPFSTTANYF